jgi:hypothetical protein
MLHDMPVILGNLEVSRLGMCPFFVYSTVMSALVPAGGGAGSGSSPSLIDVEGCSHGPHQIHGQCNIGEQTV